MNIVGDGRAQGGEDYFLSRRLSISLTHRFQIPSL